MTALVVSELTLMMGPEKSDLVGVNYSAVIPVVR